MRSRRKGLGRVHDKAQQEAAYRCSEPTTDNIKLRMDGASSLASTTSRRNLLIVSSFEIKSRHRALFRESTLMPKPGIFLCVLAWNSLSRNTGISAAFITKTAEAWLQNLDAHREELRRLFEQTYAKGNARKWWAYSLSNAYARANQSLITNHQSPFTTSSPRVVLLRRFELNFFEPPQPSSLPALHGGSDREGKVAHRKGSASSVVRILKISIEDGITRTLSGVLCL
jgi:hypothetical protein